MSEPGPFVEIVVGQQRVKVEVLPALFEKFSVHGQPYPHFRRGSSISESLSEFLRSLLPAAEKTPSPIALRFAQDIARTLLIALPPTASESVDACRAFIDEHMKLFEAVKARWEQVKEPMNAIAAKANGIARWTAARERKLAGESIDDVAALLKVKAPTIEKYLQQLQAWEIEDKSTDQNRAVVSILQRVHHGEDAYSLVREMVSISVINPPQPNPDTAGAGAEGK